MKPLKILSCLVFGLALALAGCTSDSPTEPGGGGGTPATPKVPEPVTTFRVTVTANPTQVAAGSNTPSNITVDVVRNDTGQPPADLTEVTLTTNLGGFGATGGPQTVTLQLVGGRAQAVLFPGTDIGTATVRAVVGPSAGAANVQIGQAATFFVSSIVPGVGDPQGGDEVTINGGGFDPPVRVTFNNATAQVLSVQSNRIRVRTPSATAAGVTVPVGSTAPVDVGVTINVNEVGTATDSLANGFTYAHGGGGIQQPEIFAVSPASGTNDGGTTVRITGSGFQAPVQVFFGLGSTVDNFNGVEAQVQSVTANELIVVSPAARGFGQNLVNQVVDLLVKNVNSGMSTIVQDRFKYGSDVLITAMGPGSGSFLGGTHVTIFGQGFDAPVAVSLGGIGQQVVSVTGTEIEIITTGVAVATCPANGFVTVTGVSVTNIESGATGTAPNLAFNFSVPRPLIFNLSPTSGVIGTTVTISGSDFPSQLRVTFGGDTTSGASAPVISNTPTTIKVTVPSPPPAFTFNTRPCDANGDGNAAGTQNVATPISVTVTDLGGTGCATTLANAFLLTPPNTTCTGDTAPTPACNDGIDNDSDGLIDFGTGATNDPGCTSATDNTE
ncbi:MAG TPA: IPT/TIG domain-containing protein [Thermoanaerobaculia bacterium]|nr:IPT/TIG domain-containing protein [Thermoanaerobaculia bacterium]